MELVLISQNNCRPCAELKMFLENEEVEYKEINISKNPEAIEEYNVMGAPVTILIEDGEEFGRVIGSTEEAKEDVLVLADQI